MVAAHASMTPFMLRDVVQGQRFCIHHAPAGEAHAVVLHAHALAHEMHFARPTSARAARALATAGFAVLQIDLLGCGDSSGEFEDASFDAWQQDLRAGAAWLQARHPGRPLWLWAERAAVLWAVGALAQAPEGHLLWSPVLDGNLALRQLLRTDLPAALERGSNASVIREQAHAAWQRGKGFSLGGFVVPALIASALSAKKLAAEELLASSRTGRVLRVDGSVPQAAAASTGETGLRPEHQRQVSGALPWLGPALPDGWVAQTLALAPQLVQDHGPG